MIPPAASTSPPGPTAAATGTHYTPRSLTEPIVQHTLEPLVYIGPAEGCRASNGSCAAPPRSWSSRSATWRWAPARSWCRPAAIWPSGWWRRGKTPSRRHGRRRSRTARPYASPPRAAVHRRPRRAPSRPDAEERLALARRLVADRCLYGVDKNPLAVEMAKLSLWLITLDKDARLHLPGPRAQVRRLAGRRGPGPTALLEPGR